MSTSWDSEDSFWKRTVLYSAIAVAVVAAGGAWYYFSFVKQDAPPAAPAPVAQAPEEAPPGPAQQDHHPVPEPATPRNPLPKLPESDTPIAQELAEVVGRRPVEQLLVPERVIRNIVATIDNLPRHKVAEQVRPLKPLGGQALTTTSGETILLSEENFDRYAPLMRMLDATDSRQLGELYIRYYPLFQEAYEDLGYPGQYFNDRLVEVIDHLLQTPNLRGPIELRQGRVFYEFADPKLEARSAGQKLLMRMGSENASKIKRRLQELRVVVTTSRDAPDLASPEPASPSSETQQAPIESAPPARPDSAPEARPDSAPQAEPSN